MSSDVQFFIQAKVTPCTTLAKPLDFVFLKSQFPLPIRQLFTRMATMFFSNHKQLKCKNNLIQVASP